MADWWFKIVTVSNCRSVLQCDQVLFIYSISQAQDKIPLILSSQIMYLNQRLSLLSICYRTWMELRIKEMVEGRIKCSQ